MVDKTADPVQSLDATSVEEEIAELVDLIRRARARLAEAEADVQPVINTAKERLEMLLNYRGTNWIDASGLCADRGCGNPCYL